MNRKCVQDIIAEMYIDSCKHPRNQYYIGYWTGFVAAYKDTTENEHKLEEEFKNLFLPNVGF